MQWRGVHTSGNKTVNIIRSLRANCLGSRLILKAGKHARACSGQLCGRELIQPNQSLINIWIQFSNQWFATISVTSLKKGGYFDR
jgi:hypothetical protein